MSECRRTNPAGKPMELREAVTLLEGDRSDSQGVARPTPTALARDASIHEPSTPNPEKNDG